MAATCPALRVASVEAGAPPAPGPSPPAEPGTYGELRRAFRGLRNRQHELDKRLAALRRSKEACRRSNLALIEEVGTLRSQLERAGIAPCVGPGARIKAEEELEEE